jgi:succinate dehydrogenase / fumarate reductase iron-sulfur subunit
MPLTLNLKIWRQAAPDAPGRLVDYKVTDISPDMSFLEMLDVVNEQLIARATARS